MLARPLFFHAMFRYDFFVAVGGSRHPGRGRIPALRLASCVRLRALRHWRWRPGCAARPTGNGVAWLSSSPRCSKHPPSNMRTKTPTVNGHHHSHRGSWPTVLHLERRDHTAQEELAARLLGGDLRRMRRSSGSSRRNVRSTSRSCPRRSAGRGAAHP